MKVGFIGLGRMGKNIVTHLVEQGVEVVGYSRSNEKVDQFIYEGGSGAYSLTELAEKLRSADIEDSLLPRNDSILIFLFVPAGSTVDELLFGARGGNGAHEKDMPREKIQAGLVDLLPKGAIIVDGGNSFFQDSQKRYKLLKEKGINFLDMGTSGGMSGARTGACLMVGGDKEIYLQVEPVLQKIALPNGYGYFGASGAGHFIKMIHNAIEYGMMGAIAEGFNIVQSSEFVVDSKEPIDLAKLAKVWAHGSIISGHLMNMAELGLKRADFEALSGMVLRGETEAEMEWLGTIGIPNPVIQESRKQRVATRTSPSFIGKVIAALRREFGGHAVDDPESQK